MKYAVVEAGVVINIVQWDGAADVELGSPTSTIIQIDEALPVQIGSAYADGVFQLSSSGSPAELTAEQRIALLTGHVQAVLDAYAESLGYDDIKTAVTYADEPAVPKFQAEGKALRAWRSLVWAHCYQVLKDWEAGATTEPTAEQLVDGLPAFVAPGAAS